MTDALNDSYKVPEWMHCPTGVGFLRYHKDKFAAFLERHGVTVGTPPKLPAYCVEVPEKEFARSLRYRFDKWTYFAIGQWTGRIKIGQSNDPYRRAQDLPYSSYGEEAVIAVTLRGAHFERAYHDAFRDWHEGHEWFAPHPDILAEIERLKGRPS